MRADFLDFRKSPWGDHCTAPVPFGEVNRAKHMYLSAISEIWYQRAVWERIAPGYQGPIYTTGATTRHVSIPFHSLSQLFWTTIATCRHSPNKMASSAHCCHCLGIAPMVTGGMDLHNKLWQLQYLPFCVCPQLCCCIYVAAYQPIYFAHSYLPR